MVDFYGLDPGVFGDLLEDAAGNAADGVLGKIILLNQEFGGGLFENYCRYGNMLGKCFSRMSQTGFSFSGSRIVE